MLRIGHRGAMGYEPENTLRSFKKAIDLGVDMIELDVHVCKSGELVVIHDYRVDKTTNGSGFIKNKNLSEIKKLDAGKGENIPTLHEVLDLVDRKCQVNIELKGHNTAGPVAKTIDMYIDKGWFYDDFLISSFNYFELRKFKKIKEKVRIGFLSLTRWGAIFFAKSLKAWSINIYNDVTNKKFVDAAHKKGLVVLGYTVNEKDDIKKMKDMGVDGLFSNYPDRI